jgi:hypothetical protein
LKRARVREAALAVLAREGFDAETAERLADLISHEPIPAGPKTPAPFNAAAVVVPETKLPPTAERLEKALQRVTEPH